MTMKLVVHFGITLMMATTILFSGSQVQAESNGGNYQSNSSVGFYGEYVFPEDVKPPVISPNPDPEGNQNLPQTGTSQSSLPVVGLLIVAGYLIIKKKRKKRSF